MKPYVTVTRDHNREYRVPSPDGTEIGAYYTDDWADARITCIVMHGPCIPRIRNVATHPEGR